MKITRCLRWAWLPFVLLALTGCGSLGFQRFKATAEENKAFAVTAAPHLVVETMNGAIELVAGPEDKVDCKILKEASASSQEAADQALADIEVTTTHENNTIRVIAKAAKSTIMVSQGAQIKLIVPTGSTLDFKTSNGRIHVTGKMGDLVVQTSNGGIEVVGNKGSVKADTSNGGITVEGGTGKLDVHTANGPIRIKTDKAQVDASSSNGQIHFTGTLAPGKNAFHTSNSRIELELASGSRFQLDAQTSNGKITSAFDLTPGAGSTKTHLQGRVGATAETSLEVQTSNGSIEIKKFD